MTNPDRDSIFTPAFLARLAAEPGSSSPDATAEADWAGPWIVVPHGEKWAVTAEGEDQPALVTIAYDTALLAAVALPATGRSRLRPLRRASQSSGKEARCWATCATSCPISPMRCTLWNACAARRSTSHALSRCAAAPHSSVPVASCGPGIRRRRRSAEGFQETSDARRSHASPPDPGSCTAAHGRRLRGPGRLKDLGGPTAQQPALSPTRLARPEGRGRAPRAWLPGGARIPHRPGAWSRSGGAPRRPPARRARRRASPPATGP
jgi:hypothetical protein